MDKKKIGIVCAVVVVLFLFLGFVWPGFLNGSSATTSPAVAEKVEEVKEAIEEGAAAVEGAVEEGAAAVEGAVEEGAAAVEGAVEGETK